MKLLDQIHPIPALLPVADAFSGTVASRIVECMSAEGVEFYYVKGVGAVGTATLTVLACDDTVPSNTTAVAFYYRVCTTIDTWGAWTAATTTGFTTTAGSNQAYQIWVPASELATEGYKYVKLVSTEVVDDPVVGFIDARIVNIRYGAQPTSLID